MHWKESWVSKVIRELIRRNLSISREIVERTKYFSSKNTIGYTVQCIKQGNLDAKVLRVINSTMLWKRLIHPFKLLGFSKNYKVNECLINEELSSKK